MNVVYVANDAYAMHLGISMYALFENNKKEKKIRVFVISTGICGGSLERLKEIANRFDRDLFVVDFSDIRQKFSFSIDTGRFDISTMGRLFIGELLPKALRRVLYIDCDTIVCGSIGQMFRMDLEDAIIAAVEEPTIDLRIKKDIGLPATAPYFNAGVLLIDLEKWRDEDIAPKILSYYQGIQKICLFQDQDAINGALRGQIKRIPPMYNFFTNYTYFRYETLVKLAPSYGLYRKEEFNRAKHSPCIIHFSGDERPWIRGNRNPYTSIYESYQKQTAWKKVEKVKGKEAYMFAYHAMNIMTWICPWIRKYISKAHITKARKERVQKMKGVL